MDMSHLSALELRLSRERNRLASARTSPERELRMVWIAQIEREIARERVFLGGTHDDTPDMTDDELSEALGL